MSILICPSRNSNRSVYYTFKLDFNCNLSWYVTAYSHAEGGGCGVKLSVASCAHTFTIFMLSTCLSSCLQNNLFILNLELNTQNFEYWQQTCRYTYRYSLYSKCSNIFNDWKYNIQYYFLFTSIFI